MRRSLLIVASSVWLLMGIQQWYTPSAPTTQTDYPLHVQAPEHPADYVLLGYPIDLNRADAALLEILPGIGPALARRIVADRAQHGFFAAVEDLERVPGIGPHLLRRLRATEMLTIRP